ncbi:HAD domain-containing protein [Micromonospora sp. NPDC047793]|uniref:HAD domain-containing protein n=1 Tax=unclassified Micromonospora TaxID=2617518 RepID=UPI0033DBDBE0
MVFVDIDGVLIPFRARPAAAGRAHSGSAEDGPDCYGNPLLDRLDLDDGRRLLALPGELVWASTWMAEANEVVAPRLGLPALPVVDWIDDDEEPPSGVHWKTASVARWAAERPFVWLDDEITDADRRWAAAHHPHPTLLNRVDPHVGLTDLDLAAVRRWLDHRNRQLDPLGHPSRTGSSAHGRDAVRHG